MIQVRNQAEVGTKIFFTQNFTDKKEGAVQAVRFSHHDPLFFVILRVSEVLFYRIDPESQTVSHT